MTLNIADTHYTNELRLIPSHFAPGTVGQNAFQAVIINQPVINLIIAALRRRGSGHRSVARGVARALGGRCQVTGAPEPPAYFEPHARSEPCCFRATNAIWLECTAS